MWNMFRNDVTRNLLSILASVYLLGFVDSPLMAVESRAAGVSSSNEVAAKVGGDYKVARVERDANGVFHIEFRASRPTGRFDLLRLESDHLHVGVKLGQTMRLSAEILSESGAAAEVSQVVMFLPGRSGRVPVWLLSRKAMGRDLRAVRYLEMHVPANDFVVM
jgi:hypothetical protein